MSVYYRLLLNWRKTDAGLNAQNVIYMEDPSETKTIPQMGVAIDDAWWGLFQNELLRLWTANTVRLETIIFQKMDQTPPQGGIPYTCRGSVGFSGSNSFHPVMGVVFRLFDGLAGQKHRGRLYHYCTRADWVGQSGPTQPNADTMLAALKDRWLNAFGPLPTSGLHWVLHHRNEVGAARYTRITDIRLNPRLCVQRRRNYNVGL